MSVDLRLTCAGLGKIPGELHEVFQFVVDEREYSCPVIIAEFLSPKICRIRQLDRTVLTYRLKTET